jgi:hypothetical protein
MPIEHGNNNNGEIGSINTDVLYPMLMEDYKWGNLNGNIYLDETNLRMTMNFRNNFSRLAQELILENKHDSAKKVLDYAMTLMPGEKVPLNYFIHPMIESYYQLNDAGKEKAEKLINNLYNIYGTELEYYFSFPTEKIEGVSMEILKNLQFYNQLVEIATKNNHPNINTIQQDFQEYYREFLTL